MGGWDSWKRSWPTFWLFLNQIEAVFPPKNRWSPKKRSSPKLRRIFRPKSEIQTVFPPKNRWTPKNKTKTKRSLPKFRRIFLPKHKFTATPSQLRFPNPFGRAFFIFWAKIGLKSTKNLKTKKSTKDFAYFSGLATARGHNLKSLASKVKSVALASKPASPPKCPVLGSRRALFFDLMKMGLGHDQFCFVLKNHQRACEKIFENNFFLKNAWNFRKMYKILERRFFLFGERLNFPENYEVLERRPFFFLEITSALCPWSLASSIPVLGPWPRTFLSLASTGSFFCKAVLSLGLGFFFCVVGLESCVLDSTSAKSELL